jgi:adenosine deaminase
LHDFLIALPKCEHHLHIEGTLEPNLLFELAKKNNITLPSSQDDPSWESPDTLHARYQRFTSLDDFLHYYFIGMSVLITASDFESLAWAYFQKAHSQNVKHAEIFFDPQAHISRGVSYDTILAGLSAAQTSAREEFNLTTELLVCLLRHIPATEGHELYLHTLFPSLKSGRVKGLGLSSTELNNPPHLFKDTYAHAKEHGILRTAHAGEEADVSYMASALYDLDIQRVDHGIKLPHDPALMAEYATRGIMVTMCPISNKVLHCVKDIRELPVRTYLDNNVRFSVNSDDPAYFGGYIQENYCAVQDAFGLSVSDWEKIVKAGIVGSWCSEQRREEMLEILSKVISETSKV